MAKISRENKRERRNSKTTIIRKYKKPRLMYLNLALILHLLADRYDLYSIIKDLLDKLC